MHAADSGGADDRDPGDGDDEDGGQEQGQGQDDQAADLALAAVDDIGDLGLAHVVSCVLVDVGEDVFRRGQEASEAPSKAMRRSWVLGVPTGVVAPLVTVAPESRSMTAEPLAVVW